MRGRDHHAAQEVEGHGAGLYGVAPRDPQDPDHLDDARLSLRGGAGGAREHRASGLLGVQTIALALEASGQSVGSVDFDHALAGRGQVAGEGRAEVTGALDSDRLQGAVGAQPGQQVAVAVGTGGELRIPEERPRGIDGCRVVGVLVSVDAANDVKWILCHAGYAFR